MAAYTNPDTLLLGGIPPRSETEMLQYVQDAADEMDSILGATFETPVTKNESGLPISRPVSLTLTRINRFLASGRYILAVASSGEEDGLHAYGARLVREALDALRDIVNGKVLFDAYRLPDPNAVNKGPRIANAEARSNVDAFYAAQTGSDGMMYGTPGPYNVGRLEVESW